RTATASTSGQAAYSTEGHWRHSQPTLVDQLQIVSRDHGDHHRLRAELGADRAHIGPDCRIADPELLRDLTGSDTCAHQLQHLSLARAEAAAHVLAILAPADEPGDHRRRDEAAPLRPLANRGDDLGRR